MEKEQKTERTVEDELYKWGLLALPFELFAAYVLVYWIIPILPEGECGFWKFLGIYCPGCGGTRAIVAFMHGQFLMSLWYHPVVMYFAVMFLCFILSHTLEKIHFPMVKGMKFDVWIMYGALAVIIVNFVVKNILNLCFHIIM